MTNELAGKIAELMPRARAELAQLVAFPSVADARLYPVEQCRAAARWVAEAFREAGFDDVRVVVTPDGSESVIGFRSGPQNAPTVLLYSHYDVQPALDETAWLSPPFKLTERDGRWYGRGAADSKGNILMHLTALRALGDDLPVNVRVVIEGSEEQGTAGLENYLKQHPDEFRADAVIIGDTGNAAVGIPAATASLRGLAIAVITVSTLANPVHSGLFGGAAPDALAALIRILDSLRDKDGGTVVDGLDCQQSWQGHDYDEQQFRAEAGVLDGVELLGTGSISDRIWARPAITVLGIDCTPVVGSSPSIPASVRARVSLRVPPGMDADDALHALTEHLRSHVPWGAQVSLEPEATGAPYAAITQGPAYQVLDAAMQEAYGRPLTFLGSGGSIPLTHAIQSVNPDAEIILMGVLEPRSWIHAPNESVDPQEIEKMALAEALFLKNYAAAK